MSQRFDHTEFDASSEAALNELRKEFEKLRQLIEGIGPARPTSLALTKLDECYMWTVGAIADAQRKEPGI